MKTLTVPGFKHLKEFQPAAKQNEGLSLCFVFMGKAASENLDTEIGTSFKNPGCIIPGILRPVCQLQAGRGNRIDMEMGIGFMRCPYRPCCCFVEQALVSQRHASTGFHREQ